MKYAKLPKRGVPAIERLLIETIRKEAKGTADAGVAPSVLVSKVGGKLEVSDVAVREAIWRLAHSQQIEFTEGWRVKLAPSHGAN
jgi:hypothetical protein